MIVDDEVVVRFGTISRFLSKVKQQQSPAEMCSNDFEPRCMAPRRRKDISSDEVKVWYHVNHLASLDDFHFFRPQEAEPTNLIVCCDARSDSFF